MAAAAGTTACSVFLHEVHVVEMRLAVSGICARSFAWQPLHVSRTHHCTNARARATAVPSAPAPVLGPVPPAVLASACCC